MQILQNPITFPFMLTNKGKSTYYVVFNHIMVIQI